MLKVKGRIVNSVIKEDILYLHIKALSDNSLWSFSLHNNEFKKEKVLPKDIHVIWDLNVKHDILLMETMSIEKDIIQLEKENKTK
ncbi:hypothetical protein [Pseudoalteromonas denitrificans]|uniref:Uncharacterized protein n=1 Tax=Pseudoalteromonas denitrificans DSM 6059 TaxID=1123010 RepID=A0A1I1RRV9_9GAMM|nr:hypothetical protein [Pseudoalteromonas denitrificans]SFD37076.1 hypothetical protein SAMN02745724_04322 [Pseudoalteromonas denitrificans DSM 6059]